jgi:glycosyltransferase involved in cell wall biosynthesis
VGASLGGGGKIRRKVKILHVIHSVNPQGGGPLEGIRQLVPALAAMGIATEVMSLDAPGAPGTTDFPVPLHATGPSHLNYGYTPRAVPWLRENRGNYDAIIVNGLWQYGSLAVWRALHKTSTPYYVYPHGMLDPWFQQHYPLKHLKKCLYWPWAEYRVLRDAKAVLFTAEEEKLEARKSFRPYRCHELVTGYGIAAPPGNRSLQRDFFLKRHPELDGKKTILFLGRIHEKKGCDLLLRAWKEIALSSPNDHGAETHLIMAGPIDHAYGNEMKELARQLGLERQVTWTGMLTGDLKWGGLAAADAFILPSHQENFGISVVEALACSVPVLISNKVNIWREIAEDHAGVVETDDLIGTVRLLKHWFALDFEHKEAMRANAASCFERRFDITRTAEALTALLGGLKV